MPKTFLPPQSRPRAQAQKNADDAAFIETCGGSARFMTAADGVKLRTACFPAPRDSTDAAPVLFLNGRGDFIEKNLETVDALHRRGHAVWTLDWRGQGRSTRMLSDPEKGYVPAFDTFVDDLEQFVDVMVRPALGGRPLILLAHSMGGNIGMRFLHRRPELFERAIFTAPMIAFPTRSVPFPVARTLAQVACRLLRRAEDYAPGHGPPSQETRFFEHNKLTNCRTRFDRVQNWYAYDPALQLGGITWGWLKAALGSVAYLRRPGFAEAIDLPLLVLVAEEEAVVDNVATADFVNRLPKGRLVSIAGARHELLLEADAQRAMIWKQIDDFLAESPTGTRTRSAVEEAHLVLDVAESGKVPPARAGGSPKSPTRKTRP